MMAKQQGMTLIEVLVTLVLTSLVIMLIWTTILTSMKYNVIETKKIRMQQEINYLITKIQQVHRKNDCYELQIEETRVEMSSCEGTTLYEGTFSNGFGFVPQSISDIQPREVNLDLSITIFDLTNEAQGKQRSLTVDTVFARYKDQ